MWGDASRAMAHNLDDLRERWLLSKEEVEPEVNISPALSEIDLTLPPSIDIAREWQVVIKDRVQDIQASLSSPKYRDGLGRRRLSYRLQRERTALISEMSYLVAGGRAVKECIRE